MKHFGLPGNQGYYNKLFHKSVEEFGIDISHITNNFRLRKFQNKLPLSEILVDGKFRNTKHLKTRLIKDGILENKCIECGLSVEWNGKPIVLQLDHINGNNADNRIVNLRLLCPNCHSQTATYSGRNQKQKHAHKYICKICGGPKKNTKSDKCMKCENRSRKGNTKIQWPELSVVLQMIEELGFSATGRELGVSDNAVRKHIKQNGRS